VARDLARLFPDRVGTQSVETWTLAGSEWLKLYDPADPVDQEGAAQIRDFVESIDREVEDLSLGSAAYPVAEGGFASITAIRVADVDSSQLLQAALGLWGQDRVVGEARPLTLEDGREVTVVPLADPIAQVPTQLYAFVDSDVVWLIEAPEGEVPRIVAALLQQRESQ
jgi:hypothetical protein